MSILSYLFPRGAGGAGNGTEATPETCEGDQWRVAARIEDDNKNHLHSGLK